MALENLTGWEIMEGAAMIGAITLGSAMVSHYAVELMSYFVNDYSNFRERRDILKHHLHND